MKELQALRRKLETAHDDAAEFSLVCLIQALTACVSSLKEGIHDAVLTTILSIGLWNCSTVSSGKQHERASAATSPSTPASMRGLQDSIITSMVLLQCSNSFGVQCKETVLAG